VSAPARILLAKIGLDGHDMGIKILARALRDSGCEVIYTGLRQSPETVARTAVSEDVDAIGLSLLSGAHLDLTRKMVAALAEAGCPEIPLLVGGFIPRDEVEALRDAGAAAVFPAGQALADIVARVQDTLARLAKEERR
jgi:methylmalonyl-CoA mutase C-terminal domain/subunit